MGHDGHTWVAPGGLGGRVFQRPRTSTDRLDVEEVRGERLFEVTGKETQRNILAPMTSISSNQPD